MDSELEVFLEHYGVKGQKWGVRRKQKAPPTTRQARNRAVAASIVGSGAGYIVSRKFMMNAPMTFASTFAGGAIGQNVSSIITMRQVANRSVSSLTEPPDQREAIRAYESWARENP